MIRPDCEVCHRPIKPGLGVLSVLYRDMSRAERDRAKSRAITEQATEYLGNGAQLITLAEAGPLVTPAHWRWGHARCLGTQDSYDIEENRIDDSAKALGWTLHLQDKTWFEVTDWRAAVTTLGLVSYA